MDRESRFKIGALSGETWGGQKEEEKYTGKGSAKEKATTTRGEYQ